MTQQPDPTPTDAFKAALAEEFLLSSDDVALYLTGDDPDLLRRQAEGLGPNPELLAALTPPRPRAAVVPGEGKTPGPHAPMDDDIAAAAVRSLFNPNR